MLKRKFEFIQAINNLPANPPAATSNFNSALKKKIICGS